MTRNLSLEEAGQMLKGADDILVLSGGVIEKMGPRDEILPQVLGTESAQIACDRLK